MLNGQSLRDKITRNSIRLINEHYTWDKCERKHEELYESLLKNRKIVPYKQNIC